MKQLYRRLAPYFIVAVFGALIGGSLVLGYGAPFFAKSGPQAPPPQNTIMPPVAHAQVSEARNTPVVRAAQTVGPAVVGITNKGYVRDFFNRQILVEQGTGSGVIISADGYIVTNNHVVENAQELTVSLADGRTFTGRAVGTDPATDLAVVKIDATGLPAAVFGDSDTLLVGEPAISRPTPPSTPATPAAPSSTPTASSSASTAPNSPPPASKASASPSPSTPSGPSSSPSSKKAKSSAPTSASASSIKPPPPATATSSTSTKAST